MKTLLTILFTIVTCLALHAQEKFYEGGEVSIDAFGGVNTDLSTPRGFGGAGVQYYFTENAGVGAYTSLENVGGHLFENVSVRGLWRVPIERHAFYAHGGAARVFHDDTAWIIQLGPGYEYRRGKWSFWGELGFNKDAEDETKDPYASMRAGVRFTF